MGTAILSVKATRLSQEVNIPVEVRDFETNEVLGTYTTPFQIEVYATYPEYTSYTLTTTYMGVQKYVTAGILQNNTLTITFDFSEVGTFKLEVSKSRGCSVTPESGTHYYEPNTVVTASVTTYSGYKWLYWFVTKEGGSVESHEEQTITVTMDANYSIQANTEKVVIPPEEEETLLDKIKRIFNSLTPAQKAGLVLAPATIIGVYYANKRK